jgi:hypothetical protein
MTDDNIRARAESRKSRILNTATFRDRDRANG